MKQLSHKSTGKVVRILKFNCDLNHVVYAEYEFGYTNESEPKLHTFTWSIKDSFSTTCIINDEIVNHLQSELFTDYIVEEDNTNWQHTMRHIRVYIPDGIVKSAINSGNTFGQLLIAMQTNIPAEFRIETETGVLIYLELLLDQHRALMEAYPEIIIE
jgi:hypothetical protein